MIIGLAAINLACFIVASWVSVLALRHRLPIFIVVANGFAAAINFALFISSMAQFLSN